MTEVPDWIVREVGRLHLHALALEQEIARRDAEPEDRPE